MKLTTKIFIGSALFSLLLFTSCSSDDSEAFTASASDITVTINENPAGGLSIGIITTNITGALTYSLSSQSVGNAFSIDAATGAVTVNDASAFDFESNPTLTAAVSVTNSSDTASGNVSVTLNNVDDIASFLSTSEAAYTAAAAGEWVAITEAEYNALAASLSNVTKAATSDADYTDVSANSGAGSGFTIANNNGLTIPNGGYIFAFKYNSQAANPAANKVKQSSTDAVSGYADLGGLLPDSVAGENHAVLKGSDSPTTNTGFLGIFYANSMSFKDLSTSGNKYQYGSGDTGDLPSVASAGHTFVYQGLSTTQKQWD